MKTKIVKIANIAAAVLIIAALVLSFLPYWHYTGSETQVVDGKKVKVAVPKDASLNGYLWMIDNHKELTKVFDGVAKPVYEQEYKDALAVINAIEDEEERAAQKKDLKKKTAFDTNEILGTVLLMMIFGIIALIFVARNFDSLLAPFLFVGFGYSTITGFLDGGLGGTIFHMGNTWNNYMIFVVLGGVVAALGVVSFACNLPAFLKKMKGRY